MEISIDTIISVFSLLTGGGCGAWFTWRYIKRKARAEAVSAEVNATKDMQDMYQQMLTDANTYLRDCKGHVDELREERDHYKQDRNDLREKMEKLQKSVTEWKQLAEDDRMELKREVNRLNIRVDRMAPFMCGDLQCKLRQRVTISDTEDSNRPLNTKDIEPAKINHL